MHRRPVVIEWSAAAAGLIELSPQPTLLVDSCGIILLASSTFASLVGWPAEELSWKPMLDLFAPAERALPKWLRDCGDGPTVANQHLMTRQGDALELTMRVAPVEQSSSRCFVVTVESAGPVPKKAAEDFGWDYYVATDAPNFGRLLDPDGQPRAAVSYCYTTFHSRTEPCQDCPLLRVAEPWPRRTIRATGGENYEVATGHDALPVWVSVRYVSKATLSAIHDARVARLSQRADLSERERAVLEFLLAGASLQQIAASLRLSLRTVKFHQTNVLTKLGADSRTDLLRLLA